MNIMKTSKAMAIFASAFSMLVPQSSPAQVVTAYANAAGSSFETWHAGIPGRGYDPRGAVDGLGFAANSESGFSSKAANTIQDFPENVGATAFASGAVRGSSQVNTTNNLLPITRPEIKQKIRIIGGQDAVNGRIFHGGSARTSVVINDSIEMRLQLGTVGIPTTSIGFPVGFLGVEFYDEGEFCLSDDTNRQWIVASYGRNFYFGTTTDPLSGIFLGGPVSLDDDDTFIKNLDESDFAISSVQRVQNLGNELADYAFVTPIPNVFFNDGGSIRLNYTYETALYLHAVQNSATFEMSANFDKTSSIRGLRVFDTTGQDITQHFEFTNSFGDTFFEPVGLGDCNQDDVVDFSDIPAFISVLLADDYLVEADCDQNGVVDFADIPAFIDILIGQ